MKKIVLILTLTLASGVCFAQSMKGKWTSEFALNWGFNPNFADGIWGIEFGAGVNYHILDRMGVSTQFHSFQSIIPWNPTKSYYLGTHLDWEDQWKSRYTYSMMLWNVNVFGDLFVTKKNNRLRLQIGATYFRGSWGHTFYEMYYDSSHPELGGEVIDIGVGIVNQVGMNARLSYLFNLSDKFYMNINATAYTGGEVWLDGDPYLDILSLGFSVGYKF